jgi:predicted MPP superfamily phosphohydrolase
MSARANGERRSPVGRTVARALAGVAGTSLGLRIGGRATRRVGPLEVTASATLTRAGGTDVQIPPLGNAHIASHRGPLTLTALATGVDPERAQALLGAAPERDALARDARQLGIALAGRAAAAALAGAAATAAVTLRRPRDVLGATKTSAALLAASSAVAAATLRRTAWRTPELHGLLTKAPLILGDLRSAPERIATYRDQLAELVATGTSVYRRVATLPEPPKREAIRLLHISDIHLSPLSYPLAREIVHAYGIDAVVDTGDLVDWGTPPEERFAVQIAGLGVPYVFVKGNHDSDAIAAAVAQQPNSVVLAAGDPPVEVAGLRFAGMADPRFTPDKTTGDDFAAHRVSEAAAQWAPTLVAQHVDVAVVHDPAAGRQLAGIVPLVLAGHTHNRSVRKYGNTVVVVQGSTGGSGLRGVQQDPATPVSLSVLYFDRGTRTLQALDDIALGGIGSVSLNVVRRTAAELLP